MTTSAQPFHWLSLSTWGIGPKVQRFCVMALHHMRGVMKRGFSKEALEGRYAELVAITDEVIDRDWKPGTTVPVVEALQRADSVQEPAERTRGCKDDEYG